MAKSKVKEIKWIPDEEEHDYPAAESYLRILYNRVYAQLVLVNAGGLPPLGLFVDESTNCLYDGSIN